MAQFAHQGFDVGGDDRLVLDDQHVGGQFGVDLGLGLGDQRVDSSGRFAEDLAGLVDREALERGQQEGLARRGGMRMRRCETSIAARSRAVFQLGAGVHQMAWKRRVERHARRQVGSSSASPAASASRAALT